MANRETGYGLTVQVAEKLAAKYDIHKQNQARIWMEEVVGEPMDPESDYPEAFTPDRFHGLLKNGAFLCKVANKVTGANIKIHTSKMVFKQMENISHFLTACENFGVNRTDLFQTVDLFENQNMWQVVCCIHALGRKAQARQFNGPTLGPREATTNKRIFTTDQITAGKNVIGMQMGSNKGAYQTGMSFGARRHINDIKCEEISQQGKAVIGIQMGTNQGASQAGMSFGARRHINDIKCDEISKGGQAVIGLQMGSNKGAYQTGMSFGARRDINN